MFLACSLSLRKNKTKLGVVMRQVSKEMHFDMWDDSLRMVEETTRTFKILE